MLPTHKETRTQRGNQTKMVCMCEVNDFTHIFWSIGRFYIYFCAHWYRMANICSMISLHIYVSGSDPVLYFKIDVRFCYIFCCSFILFLCWVLQSARTRTYRIPDSTTVKVKNYRIRIIRFVCGLWDDKESGARGGEQQWEKSRKTKRVKEKGREMENEYTRINSKCHNLCSITEDRDNYRPWKSLAYAPHTHDCLLCSFDLAHIFFLSLSPPF